MTVALRKAQSEVFPVEREETGSPQQNQSNRQKRKSVPDELDDAGSYPMLDTAVLTTNACPVDS